MIHSGAAAELRALVEKLHIPTTYTLLGIGGLPGNHPQSLGMLGMHGHYRANLAVAECDVLVAIGARFDDRVVGKKDEFSVHSRKIHVDIDPTSIQKTIHADIPIVGDAKNCLQKFLKLLDEKDGKQLEDYRERMVPWQNIVNDWDEENPTTYDQSSTELLLPQFVIDTIYRMTSGNAVITTDVGQHQMWAAQYYHAQKPHNWVTSGGLGTMGYGLPAALGAQVARPDELVVCITGDGSIMMNIQELTTAVESKLPVKVVIINNQCLGMVRQWQQHFYENRESAIDLSTAPDFVKLAEAFGALGLRATRVDEVESVLRQAFDHPGPAVIDFRVNPLENCYPMVPSGSPSSKMLLNDPA